MFNNNYNFFDYKYNIVGYHGQHFGSIYQYIYLAISVILLIVLLFIFRKLSKEKVLKVIQIISLFLIVFYFGKTIWESIYDIKLTGNFNTGLLPFDTCSMVMLAGIFSGYGKGKIKDISTCWLATGCILGGVATMVYLNAFKYYPFLSFGAFYSMIWHFLMVFLGLLLIVTNYVDVKYTTVIKGYMFHLIVSLFVIPIDYIYNFDFMMYKDLGGIPFFEDVASYLNSNNLGFFNPLIMLILYFLAFNIIFILIIGIKRLVQKDNKKNML